MQSVGIGGIFSQDCLAASLGVGRPPRLKVLESSLIERWGRYTLRGLIRYPGSAALLAVHTMTLALRALESLTDSWICGKFGYRPDQLQMDGMPPSQPLRWKSRFPPVLSRTAFIWLSLRRSMSALRTEPDMAGRPDDVCCLKADKAELYSTSAKDPKAIHLIAGRYQSRPTKSPGNAGALIVTADRTMNVDQYFATTGPPKR
jgi:hypothetical protein